MVWCTGYRWFWQQIKVVNVKCSWNDKCAGKPESDDRGYGNDCRAPGENIMNTDEATLGKQDIFVIIIIIIIIIIVYW